MRIIEGSVSDPIVFREMAAGAAGRRRARVAVAPGSQELAADVTVVVRDGLIRCHGPAQTPALGRIVRVRTARYGPPMADQPSWRQGFDALEQQLSPRLEALVQSEQFAVAVGLAARRAAGRRGRDGPLDAPRCCTA